MRRRRWPLALVASLVALASALTFAVLWLNAGDRKPVLVVSRPVPAGQVLSDGDLGVVRVSTDPGLRPIPASQRREVIGQTVSTGLVPGSLLTRAHLGGNVTLLGAGQAVVGVSLEGGQLLTPNLRVGDQVLIVQTPSAGASSTGSDAQGGSGLGLVLGEGRVFNVQKPDQSSRTVVISLSVAREIAPAVASANSAERVSLVLVPAA